MRSEVDLIGVQAVCTLITQSKLPKFIIFRHGAARGSTPTFEFRDGKSAEVANKAFRDWANTLIMANPDNSVEYDIICFSDEGDPEEGGAKKNKIRFSFILGNREPVASHISAPSPIYQQNAQEDIKTLVADAAEKLLIKYKLEQLEKENKELKEQVEELEDEVDQQDGMGSSPILEKFASMMYPKPKADAAVSEPHDKDEKIKILRESIARLAKYDPQIHIHLEKLADIAENKNSQFKMLISMLDQM